MKKIIFTLLFISLSFAWAGDTFSLDLQSRTRFEANGKTFVKERGFDNYTYMRNRLGLSFKASETASAYVQIQDSRIMGSETATLGDGSADLLDFHQMYIEFRLPFDIPLSLKLGRFEANYGNQRLLGAVGWHNVGRSFDGLIARYNSDNFSLDFFNFKEKENNNLGDFGDKNVAGTWLRYTHNEQLSGNANIIWQRTQGPDQLSRINIGGDLAFNFSRIRGTVEANYQTGKNAAGYQNDISAWMLALFVQYIQEGAEVFPKIGLGIDYLSGDDKPGDDTYKTFNTLYATNHKFYGMSDMFLNLPRDTYGAGLNDMYVRSQIIKVNKFSADATFHLFYTAEDVYIAGKKENHFANELDLIINYVQSEHIKFQSGYSIVFPGKIFEAVKGKDPAHFFYFTTTFALK